MKDETQTDQAATLSFSASGYLNSLKAPDLFAVKTKFQARKLWRQHFTSGQAGFYSSLCNPPKTLYRPHFTLPSSSFTRPLLCNTRIRKGINFTFITLHGSSTPTPCNQFKCVGLHITHVDNDFRRMHIGRQYLCTQHESIEQFDFASNQLWIAHNGRNACRHFFVYIERMRMGARAKLVKSDLFEFLTVE